MPRRLAALVLAAAVLAAAPAAALGPVDAEAGLGLHGKYVWRGQIVTDEAVLQPEAAVSLAGFSLGVWGNVDLTDVNGYGTSLNETDWTLRWGVSLPLLSLEAGAILYDYPSRGPDDTVELYAGAEAHVPLSPRLFVYRDVKDVDGTYLGAGCTWSRDLAGTAGLELAADLGWGSAGYVQGYFGPEAAGLADLTAAARLPWRALPLVTVTPHVTWATLLGDAADAVEAGGGDTDAVFCGATARVAF